MKIKKIIRWAVIGIGGLAFLLFATLIVHIAIMVKTRPPLANATLQIARADFLQPVDSLNAVKMEKKVRGIKGVESTYFNLKDYSLVYTFDNRLNTAGHIYDEAIKDPEFPSKRYIVSTADLQKGCPVMSDHSFYGKLTAAVTKIIR